MALLVAGALAVGTGSLAWVQATSRPLEATGVLPFGTFSGGTTRATSPVAVAPPQANLLGTTWVVTKPTPGSRVALLTGMHNNGRLPVTVTDIQLTGTGIGSLVAAAPLVSRARGSGGPDEPLQALSLGRHDYAEFVAVATVSPCDGLPPGSTVTGVRTSSTTVSVSYRLLGMTHRERLTLHGIAYGMSDLLVCDPSALR